MIMSQGGRGRSSVSLVPGANHLYYPLGGTPSAQHFQAGARKWQKPASVAPPAVLHVLAHGLDHRRVDIDGMHGTLRSASNRERKCSVATSELGDREGRHR